ncbi:SMI1/KNR4 family protein [Endozoicomonas sp. SCSIO W0465]|uniref:SMI1/KNR4 family protein n=1 Tax=Endozoicomonas sp. SCSIO W0465 TaxID=2918516 RepID=UPI00207542B8|nr:SMI1/KNR4 family protein [Endozoicomonas sp. SCSIO W0465]USE38513.1 SMI1/KNR4 family protein [Endozoicomonas sp. SCSIO W0465]
MEDIIEELRECALDVSVPLELPDEDQLVEVEEQILIPLPYELREFLLQVSDVIYGSIEPVTVTDPQSHTYLPEVAANAWAEGLPRELIPICECNGEYYGISEEGEVVRWADGEVTDDSWPSIWLWAWDIWLER